MLLGVLPVLLAVCVWGAALPARAGQAGEAALRRGLADLERQSGGRLGLALLDPATGRRFAYRGDERFPLCSTFKLMLAAAVLRRSVAAPETLSRRVTYGEADLLAWAPVTRERLPWGMTVEELCAAAIEYSDNTAANLLLNGLGGPAALTAYARGLGDKAFRLDRREPELNTAVPGDPRDTTTPEAMARTVERLVLGDGLPQPQQEKLVAWLKGNTTGNASIRAGVPPGWTVGDKTGSGDFGTTNDVAVLWPPKGYPMVLAVYFTQPRKDAPPRKDVLAAATRLVLGHF
ncbi:class A beta-lactamase [Solidesulfovibrio sp.]|uniref:class A beta-lactamase n=1 Tax=Solidesulfovibrio sp. TaxID=2910990 RepID=UPI002629D0D5|nr:class A beta-lactamase [Solidesulfovibrio sp.]